MFVYFWPSLNRITMTIIYIFMVSIINIFLLIKHHMKMSIFGVCENLVTELYCS